MRIELLHVEDCPGHAELRERLPRLLATAGVDAEVVERLIDSERQAQVARFVGSPTVRVDGRDVDPDEGVGASGYGLRCRLYATAAGLRRSPPDELILAALAAGSGAGPAGRHNTEGGRRRWRPFATPQPTMSRPCSSCGERPVQRRP